MAKQSANKKAPPVPNEDAIRKMAEERRAALPPNQPKFEAKRNPAVEEAFLDGLRDGWSVKKSAWGAGIDSTTAYDWKNKSLATLRDDGSYKDDFCVRWEAAHRDGVDVLEDEAHRRAVKGVERPVYQGGVLVGTTTEYSDTLLNLKLRGKRPDIYNTERHELSGPAGGPIPTSMEIEFMDSKGKK